MSFLDTDRNLARSSYYAATAPRARAFPALEGSVECDVAIVGGGLAGLSAAIELADRGDRVVLLEAKEVGWGASGRNGGQVIAGLACDQAALEALVGLDDARRIWAMTLEGVDIIRARRERFGIDCDWQPGYLAVAVTAKKARELRRWHDDMARAYGFESEWIAPSELPRWIDSPRFHSAVHDPRGGHLHPLAYSLGLARAAAQLGVQVHEHSAVTQLDATRRDEPRLRTAQGEVRARKVLLAGNVYLHGIVPALDARIMPVGTYMVASEPLAPALAHSLIPSQAAVSDTNFVLDYFRTTPDHRMLFGGRISYSTATPRNLEASMQRRMAATFPQLEGTRIDYAWGGFVDITMNRAPDFGRLSTVVDDARRPGLANVYYLQGFSGHGLALTGLAGRVVAEAMHGHSERFDTFARIRHRAFPGGRLLRMPALVAGMAYYRLRDLL